MHGSIYGSCTYYSICRTSNASIQLEINEIKNLCIIIFVLIVIPRLVYRKVMGSNVKTLCIIIFVRVVMP